MICIDNPKSALQIVELVHHEFPQEKLLVRSYDRGHAVELNRAGVDYQIRETAEAAYLMGAKGLRALGFAEQDFTEARGGCPAPRRGVAIQPVPRRCDVAP